MAAMGHQNGDSGTFLSDAAPHLMIVKSLLRPFHYLSPVNRPQAPGQRRTAPSGWRFGEAGRVLDGEYGLGLDKAHHMTV